jgi:hypothetical protein
MISCVNSLEIIWFIEELVVREAATKDKTDL